MHCRVGTLSTVASDGEASGFPSGSVVEYAPDEKGRPIFMLSSISPHTKHLRKDSRCSFTVLAPAFRVRASTALRQDCFSRHCTWQHCLCPTVLWPSLLQTLLLPSLHLPTLLYPVSDLLPTCSKGMEVWMHGRASPLCSSPRSVHLCCVVT